MDAGAGAGVRRDWPFGRDEVDVGGEVVGVVEVDAAVAEAGTVGLRRAGESETFTSYSPLSALDSERKE